jgi:Ca2+-binding RTX toxin-like protein
MVTFVRSNSIFANAGAYTAVTGETIVVDSTGFLVSRNANAIWLNANNAAFSITIEGVVFGGGASHAGILFGGSSSVLNLTVGKTGSIHGAQTGLALFSGTPTLTNGGSITGGTSSAVSFATVQDTVLVNTGLMASKLANAVTFGLGTHVVKNSGRIEAGPDKNAIQADINPVAAGQTKVEKVTNSGTMIGGVQLGADDDRYDGRKGKISGIIDGGADNDTILGGAGGETLKGGLGADRLTGNGGADHFRFDTALGAGNIDTIRDFSRKTDTIELGSAVMPVLGATLTKSEFVAKASDHKATNTKQHIIYDQDDGTLWYDPDGNKAGGVAAVQFAIVSGQPALTHNDFLIV